MVVHSRSTPYVDSPAVSTVVGTVWETLEVAVKPYPSCRYTHAALDGVAALQRRHGFDAAEVTDVQIGLPKAGMILVGDPIEHRFGLGFLSLVCPSVRLTLHAISAVWYYTLFRPGVACQLHR